MRIRSEVHSQPEAVLVRRSSCQEQSRKWPLRGHVFQAANLNNWLLLELPISRPQGGPACGPPRHATVEVVVKTSVRQATAADLLLLQAIEDEADALFASIFSIGEWRPAPSGIERSRQRGYILVASERPGLDPFGFAHVLESIGGDHLEQLSVRPALMRRGHGRALVEAVKGESRRRGRKRVTLRTYADVPWNAPFYSSCGFVESDPDTDFLRDLLIIEQRRGLGCVGWCSASVSLNGEAVEVTDRFRGDDRHRR